MSVQTIDTSTPKPRKRPFSLHWSVVVLWGVFVLAALVFAGVRGAFGDSSRAYALGSAVGKNAIFCLVLSWVVFRIAGRSKVAASVTFGVLVVISAATFAVFSLQAVRVSQGTDNVSVASKAAHLRQLEATKQGDLHAANAESDRHAEWLSSEAKRQSGDRRLGMEVGSECIKQMAPVREEMAAAYEAFVKAGSIDVSTLGTRELVEERIAMVDRILRAAGAVDPLISKMFPAAKQRLIERGMNPKNADEWISGFAKGINEPLAVRTRQLGVDIHATMRRVLEIHLEHFGKIVLNEEGGMEADVPDDVLEEFNVLADRITTLGEEQVRVVEAQQRLKGGGAGPATPGAADSPPDGAPK